MSSSRQSSAHLSTQSVAEPSASVEAFPLVDAMLAAPEVKQTFGVVEGSDGPRFFVRAGAEVVHARRSKSCLIQPAVGDMVLVARSEHHGSYVLTVLASPDETAASVVSVEGDLTLRSSTGKVDIVGPEGVSVTSGREVSVHAPELVANTMKATLFADSLSYVGRQVEAQVERVRLVGHALESAFDVFTSRLKHSYRTIEEVENVKAKELHMRAEGTLNMHGKNTLMTAEKLVKLDGEQIHLG